MSIRMVKVIAFEERVALVPLRIHGYGQAMLAKFPGINPSMLLCLVDVDVCQS